MDPSDGEGFIPAGAELAQGQVLGHGGGGVGRTSVPAVEWHCTHSSIDTLIFDRGWCFTRKRPSHSSGCLVLSF